KALCLLESPVLNVWNESGTNRARIGDSAVVRLRSLRYMAPSSALHTRSGGTRHRGALSRGDKRTSGSQSRFQQESRARALWTMGMAVVARSLLRFGDWVRLHGGLGQRDKFRGAQQSNSERGGHRETERDHNPRPDDRRQPDFGLTQRDEIFDCRAVRHVAGDRGEIDRADCRGPLVAAISL